MSYDEIETSRELGAPQTLYRFTHGSTVLCYTDAEQSITFSGHSYQPIPIQHAAITASGGLDKSAMPVTLPCDTAVAELFRVFPPSQIVWLTIFEGHEADPEVEFLAKWSGRVLSGTREGSTSTLNCEPVTTSMRRPGLRRRWQYGCPHALYGKPCGVSRDDFTVTTTVITATGATIHLASGWNGSHDKALYLNGLMEFTFGDITLLRTVLRVDSTANNLVVSGPVSELGTGDTIKLSLGCDHQMTGCAVFSNLPNFGGQPFIPKRTPIGFVNQFY